jgi:HK97 family phage major capsid protein
MLKKLYADKLELVNAMRVIADNPNATADDNAKFDTLDSKLETINAQIKRLEKIDAEEKTLAATTTPVLPTTGTPSAEQTKEHEAKVSAAFGAYLRFGVDGLSAEQKQIMRARFQQGDIRAAQTVTTSGGGYLVPQGFSGQLEEALKSFGGMLEAAEIVNTESGNPLPWPTVNDTGNVGELLGINTAAASQDFSFGQVNLNAYKYSSKIVLVPIELLQDSAFDLNAFVARKLAERIGRIWNTHFTVGTGSGQPNGVVTAATSGKVGTTGQTTSVIYDDLVDLFHSVDPAHRASKGCRFMLNDASLKVIKKIKDSQGRPLWQAGLAGGTPDMILDKPYTINQDVATMAANAKSILFGDFSKYKIRRVMDTTVLRLTERYAEFGQVGFIAFSRADGNLIDAGSHPVTYYANSAT